MSNVVSDLLSGSPFETIYHSVLRDFTGFAMAALIA